MKKSLTLTAVIVLVIYNSYLIYQNYRDRKREERVIHQLYTYVDDIVATYQGLLDEQYLNCGLTLDTLRVFYPGSDSICYLSSVLDSNQQHIICRFDDTFCNDCNKYAINQILKFKRESPQHSVVFLCTFHNHHSLQSFKEEYRIDPTVDIYLVQHLQLPIERTLQPYYLTLSPSQGISSVFIPDTIHHSFTNSYLQLFCKRY